MSAPAATIRTVPGDLEPLPAADTGPTFMYMLGPPIEPSVTIYMGNMRRNARAWAALDLLLTAGAIAEACDLTWARYEVAGIPFP